MPPPLSAIAGMPCFMHRNGPLRFTSMTRCHCSSPQSMTDERVSTAAEQTSTSSRPSRSRGRVDHRGDLALARDVDRHRLDGAAGCREVVGDLLPRGSSTSATTTRSPSSANRLTIASPSPDAPPVTMITATRAWPSRHRIRGEAAVARDHGARGVRRRVAREEQRDRGHVVGGADAVRAGPGRRASRGSVPGRRAVRSRGGSAACRSNRAR